MGKGLHFSGSRSGSQIEEELKNPHKWDVCLNSTLSKTILKGD